MEEVVVFAALAWEARAVLDGLQGIDELGDRAWRGYLGDGAPVRVLQIGVGPERARRAAETARGARLLVSAGCAGGLGTVRAGELVLADRVVALDPHGAAVESIAVGAAALAEWSAARGLAVRTGTVVSSPTMLVTRHAKVEAGRHGVVVEMESAAIAAVARERGQACSVVKVVLDEATDELALPEGSEVVDAETGELDVTRGVTALALRPRAWPTAIRLARLQRVADRRLRDYLAVVLSAGLAAFGLSPDRRDTTPGALAG
jgi:nucleoside phosphorylase